MTRQLDEEPVAGCLDLAAVEERELRAQQALVLGDEFRRGHLLGSVLVLAGVGLAIAGDRRPSAVARPGR